MSPYLAVIRDSFRAALTSRVLWIAFFAIWLLLIGLAPIGYREGFTTTFRGRDFHNGTRLKAMLAKGLVDEASIDTPPARIAAAMPEDLTKKLRLVGDGEEVRVRYSVLADALNGCLDDESWYDEEAWDSTLRFRELRELEATDAGELSDSERRRRARLRIEAAFPGVFETRDSRSITMTYAGRDFPANLAVDKTQFLSLINQFVIPIIIEWLMGFVLVFLGILVTASIVPDMLQPGSLHLLLSKPVSRTLLLLSKFFGGCAFVFLCVLQLVIGLYLIAGWRLDVWNIRLLWCIPVSVFLFSVFYSVSTLAGLIWRSPILAIGVTTIFGTVCLVVGIIGGVFDGLVTRPESVQHLAVVGENLVGSTRGGGLIRMDRGTNKWVEILESNPMSGDRMIAPIALDSETVLTAQVRGGRFNPFGSGALDLLLINQSDDWTPEPSLRLPTGTSSLYLADDQVLALSAGELAATDRTSILEAAGRENAESDQEEQKAEEQQGWLNKLTNMMGGATTGFTSVLPDMVSMAPPRGVIADPGGKWLLAMSRGRLIRLSPSQDPSKPWELVASRTLDGEASRRGAIAVSDNRLLVARAEEEMQILDAESFETIATVELSSSLLPIAAVGLNGDGRFLLMTSDGRCRVVSPLGADGTQYEVASPLATREAESICFDPGTNRLYVAHHTDRVDVFDADSLTVVDRIRPSVAGWRLIDRYVMGPLRIVIPQTGELGETIEAMVSGKSAVTIDDGTEEGQLIRYDIIRPVVSCSLFITVMLTVSCIFFASRDF